ncbi:MAG TPA: GNAT family N-acetyltransferase [Pyrinomonadaceae bacterium]|jgi:ribosomal protein S18 acetylase RimI-like enzyme
MRLQTELIFWRRHGHVVDRGSYLRVETPSNPSYYGGNLLVFEDAPAEGDERRWPELFAREFAHNPEIRHVLFGWDIRDNHVGEVEAFLDAGYVMENDVTLLADEVHPPPHVNREIEIRRIETEADWASMLEIQVRCRHERFELEAYKEFKKRKIKDQRALIDEGVGDWYGAFIGERAVSNLGLFREGEMARFQEVGTDPDFRRRGICGTLVHHVSRTALEQQGVKTLVMAADENYHAAKIYESVGFRPRERFAWLCLYPPK